ncbi:MAG: hypothetical protein EOP85_23850 [Verrucomicrobiaceae bacterium]|nr:MAG: hypothetical protein EOP85_23850 [Verrucomicrobiaceae bacterium]
MNEPDIAGLIRYEQAKKAVNLPSPELEVLYDLQKHGTASYESISHRCDINGDSLLRYVRNLRRRKLVTRVSAESGDFRTALFKTTEDGEQMVKELIDSFSKAA